MRWLTSPVVQFLAAGLVALAIVVLATSALSRDAADEEAIHDARTLTTVLGRSVAQPAVPRGLVDGTASAIDRMDQHVLDRLLVWGLCAAGGYAGQLQDHVGFDHEFVLHPATG